MTGLLLAVLFYRPIYRQMLNMSDLTSKVEVPETKNITRVSSPDKEEVTITTQHSYSDGTQLIQTSKEKADGTITAGKPEVKLSQMDFWKMIMLIFVQVVFVTMAYGPIAAFLVELFPTKIRYTSMSLPYHIGNGVFGGLVPFIATLLATTFTTDPLVGLWYPIGVAALCFIIGALYLSNKADKNVND